MPFLLISQTINVKDYQTGEPVEMATIMSESPVAMAKTNARGQADISLFKGAEIIEIHRLGYALSVLSYSEMESQGFQLMLIPSNVQYDEIVVSATRWSEPSRNIPTKISHISAEDIALQNPQTAADMLAASGEVFIQKSQQGGGSPMIRGFSTNRLLYTVDGIRMNSAIFRSGNIQNVISLDAFTIENAEVLFGPGSVIYGSDAIGGVMSFQTITPQFSMNESHLITGNAATRFSSANDEQTFHFDLTSGWRKWSSVTSFTHSSFGDLRMGSYGPDSYLKHFTVQRLDSIDRVFENADPKIQSPSGYDQTNLMQKIAFRPNKKLEIIYGFHYSETSAYSRYDRLIETQDNGLPVYAVWNYGPQIWMMNNVTVTHAGNNKVYDIMTMRLGQQKFEESRIDRRFNHHRLRTNLEEVMAYSANIDFERSLKEHKLFYGAEYVLNDVKSFGTAIDIRDGSSIAVPDRYPASEWQSYAAYLNYHFEISKEMLFQAGIRYSAFQVVSDFTRHLSFYPFEFSSSELKNSSVTGSAGFVYSPDKTWKISLNAGTGFRAPNVDDIGKIFDFADGEVVVPNTNLRAENAYNGEIGISKVFGERFKVDLTGFYTYLDQAMVRRTYQVNGQDSILFDDQMSQVYAIQNAAYGSVYGLNAGIEMRHPSGFGFLLRYNYQLGEEEMDNGVASRSRHAAPAFGVARILYRKNKLDMQVYGTYCAEVSNENLNPEEQSKPVIYALDKDGKPFSPEWYTLNFKVAYQFLQHLAVSGGVENITDQRYRPYSSGLVGAGRNLILSLRANF
jgi:hemoglobin/transferrin/lactoferrin receptor protein